MAESLLLGVDIGTTAVKAAVFGSFGELKCMAVYPTPVSTPKPGWSECDMVHLWRVTASAIRDVVGRYHFDSDQLVAIGMTGNMGGAWLADDRDLPVRPAILWNDGRASSLLRNWHSDGTLGKIFSRSLSAIGSGFTLPLLLWLREHEPAVVDQLRHVAFAKDWIRFHLTGDWVTDPSEITHVPGDVATGYRSMSLLEDFGVQELEHRFPPLRNMAEVAGEVLPQAADMLGIRAYTPVATGAGDVTAATIGMSATGQGQYSVIAGTSCLVSLACATVNPHEPTSGITFLVPGGLLRSQPNQAGTRVLDWIARNLWGNAGAIYEQMEAAAATVQPGCGGLLFLPYLSNTGLVAPVYEPSARGQLFGLSLEHDKAHITRAAFEGLALAVADGIAHLPGGDGSIRMAGGLARSDFWCQLVADVTGHEVLIPHGEELGALGACILGATAIGLYPEIASAQAAMVRTARTYEPDRHRHDFYREALTVYQAVQRALLPLFQYRERLVAMPTEIQVADSD